ncbi:MAG: preprotein translocase subunit YajC [Gaiellaceae bacterium]
MAGFLILIVLFGAAWLFFVLPSRRRRMSHSAMQNSISAGDEVITAGGLHGTVRELEGETLQLEIAPGVVATLDRRAVAAVARDVVVEVDAVEETAVEEGAVDENGVDENPPTGLTST